MFTPCERIGLEDMGFAGSSLFSLTGFSTGNKNKLCGGCDQVQGFGMFKSQNFQRLREHVGYPSAEPLMFSETLILK